MDSVEYVELLPMSYDMSMKVHQWVKDMYSVGFLSLHPDGNLRAQRDTSFVNPRVWKET